MLDKTSGVTIAEIGSWEFMKVMRHYLTQDFPNLHLFSRLDDDSWTGLLLLITFSLEFYPGTEKTYKLTSTVNDVYKDMHKRIKDVHDQREAHRDACIKKHDDKIKGLEITVDGCGSND